LLVRTLGQSDIREEEKSGYLQPENRIHSNFLFFSEWSVDNKREKQWRGDIQLLHKPPMEFTLEQTTSDASHHSSSSDGILGADLEEKRKWERKGGSREGSGGAITCFMSKEM
jgi:hypothetical protein